MTTADLDRLMEQYRENVKALFKEGSAELIDNSSPRHAAILIEEMVIHAKSSFVAFAGRMNPEVWTPAVMSALAEALSRSVEVRLLVEKECLPISNGTMPESVRKCVRKLGDQLVERIKTIDVAHCACGDGQSLRIEMDPDTKSAKFSANNPEIASRIVSIFDNLYGMGVAYNAA